MTGECGFPALTGSQEANDPAAPQGGADKCDVALAVNYHRITTP